MIDIETKTYTHIKMPMQFPPIAFSLDYQMSERLDSKTIANHLENGVI